MQFTIPTAGANNDTDNDNDVTICCAIHAKQFYSILCLAILQLFTGDFLFFFLLYLGMYSACFFSLKKWEAAGEDATSCVQKDSSFIKGYYRLALALTEQGLYDDASSTLLNACKLEPDNAQLLKQLRVVRAKKAAQAKRESAAKGPQKQLDDTQRHEVRAVTYPVLCCDVLDVLWGVGECNQEIHIQYIMLRLSVLLLHLAASLPSSSPPLLSL